MFSKYDTQELFRFLSCVNGNWHNAIHISCCRCPCPDLKCRGYLFTADDAGCPILYPVDKFFSITGETIEAEDCIGTLSFDAFFALFFRWYVWHTGQADSCYIKQMYEAQADRKQPMK